MGRSVSATGQFLLATYGQFQCPPVGSFRCPLTTLVHRLEMSFANLASLNESWHGKANLL